MINKKISINWVCFLMIYSLLVLPLIYTHTSTFYNTIALFIFLFCSYVIGGALLIPVSISNLLLPLSDAALSIFIGSLVCSLLVFVTVSPLYLIISLLAITVLILVYYRHCINLAVTFNGPNMFAFIVTLLVFAIVSSLDFSEQFSATLPNRLMPYTDPYFFTSIVASFRHGTIFSAAYEVNTPVNYQALAFFMPAMLADILNISSHQALWGLAQPFYKFLAILLCYEVCYFFMKDKVARNNYWFILFSLSFPILLAPLRPYYIMKGALSDFMFFCFAYMFPNGVIFKIGPYIWTVTSVSWPFTIALLLFCLLLFSNADWQKKKISADKVFFTIALALMAISKIPMYIAFMAFIGIIMLKRVVFDKEKILNYIGYLLSSVIISAILFKICMGHSTAGRNSFHYDHFRNLLLDQPLISGYRGKGILYNIVLIALILASYLAWLSIRLVGLWALVKSKISKLNDFFLGAIASVLLTTVLASFLHMEISSYGVLYDTSYDVRQFLVASFYILTIVSVAGMLRLFYSSKLIKKYAWCLYIATGAWCCISLVSLIFAYNDIAASRDVGMSQYSWYNDNLNELKTGKYDDGLLVVNPHLNYYGVMLASSDYGKYWTALDRSSSNWNCSNKNEYRWYIFRDLLTNPDQKYLLQMKNEGVKYIISTPEDSSQILHVSKLFPKHVQKIENTKWIYALH